ncbi:MAG: uridylate kinase [Parcubacteria group bacterium Gr01-1014_30]|nr:MAG: uridylate kinase [Parcubacteria group bacterium Gr01-1014_30]
MPEKARFKRILLKLSGETLGGRGGFGLDVKAAEYIAGEIKSSSDLGCQTAVVIGGGNFVRGEKLSHFGVDRSTADYMGMLGTVINGLALQSILEKKFGLATRVMTSFEMKAVAEPFFRRRALRHLEKGRVVIFAGGTGSPYFSTDTAAALRASEIESKVILKATKVRGVYESDPKTNKNAKFLPSISHLDMVKMGLKVMDLTALTLAMYNKIPVIVFDVFKKGNLVKLLLGQKIGTEIRG